MKRSDKAKTASKPAKKKQSPPAKKTTKVVNAKGTSAPTPVKKSSVVKIASKEKPRKAKSEDEVRVVEPEIISPEEISEEFEKPIKKAETAIATADPMTRYLAELRNYPLLTREQEKELAVKYFESGDAKAAETLVTSNLRFVVKIATEYAKFGAKLIDLVQEGNVGLMHAVKEFNPYKGVRLITYAVWWIRGYIQEYLMRQYSMVRIGTTQTQRKLFYQLQKQKEELERLGLEAGIPQLSGRLGVGEDEVRDMSQRLSGRDVSLDQPLSDGDKGRLMDFQSQPLEESLDDQLGNLEQVAILKEKIDKIRPGLSAKEQVILEQRLLADEPKTLQEIGEQYGITREAVRQLEARLISKIKKEMTPES